MTKIIIHNAITGEIVERDANETELANIDLVAAGIEAIAKARIERALAKAALLDKLGITADEAALLLG